MVKNTKVLVNKKEYLILKKIANHLSTSSIMQTLEKNSNKIQEYLNKKGI